MQNRTLLKRAHEALPTESTALFKSGGIMNSLPPVPPRADFHAQLLRDRRRCPSEPKRKRSVFRFFGEKKRKKQALGDIPFKLNTLFGAHALTAAGTSIDQAFNMGLREEEEEED